MVEFRKNNSAEQALQGRNEKVSRSQCYRALLMSSALDLRRVLKDLCSSPAHIKLRFRAACAACAARAARAACAASKVCEVCVETTVVVDTLGPARRGTHGVCVTVRCQGKKKDRLDAEY